MAGLLAAPADDIEELAKAICRKINQMRAEEENWVRVVKFGGREYLMYGPYRSAAEAREDDTSRGPTVGDIEVRCWSLFPPWAQGEE